MSYVIMSALGQTAPVFQAGAALGTDPAKTINFKNQYGYDPVEKLLERIEKAPTTQKGVDKAIGGLLNWGFVGRDDVNELKIEVNRIADPLKREFTRNAIEKAIEGNFGYATAQPEKALEARENYLRSEENRKQEIEDVLGDKAFAAGREKLKQSIKQGSASLETYRYAYSIGNQQDANAVKLMWLKIFFPEATSEQLRTVILNIGLNEPPEWIEKTMNYALDLSRRAFEGDFSGDLNELLQGDSNVEDAAGNVLHVGVMGISNMTQALGQLLAGKPQQAKLYAMKEMLRQLSTNMGGDSGLRKFYERNKGKPIGAVETALPFIVGTNSSLDLINDLIDNVADKFTFGLVDPPEIQEEEADDALVDVAGEL